MVNYLILLLLTFAFHSNKTVHVPLKRKSSVRRSGDSKSNLEGLPQAFQFFSSIAPRNVSVDKLENQSRNVKSLGTMSEQAYFQREIKFCLQVDDFVSK